MIVEILDVIASVKRVDRLIVAKSTLLLNHARAGAFGVELRVGSLSDKERSRAKLVVNHRVDRLIQRNYISFTTTVQSARIRDGESQGQRFTNAYWIQIFGRDLQTTIVGVVLLHHSHSTTVAKGVSRRITSHRLLNFTVSSVQVSVLQPPPPVESTTATSFGILVLLLSSSLQRCQLLLIVHNDIFEGGNNVGGRLNQIVSNIGLHTRRIGQSKGVTARVLVTKSAAKVTLAETRSNCCGTGSPARVVVGIAARIALFLDLFAARVAFGVGARSLGPVITYADARSATSHLAHRVRQIAHLFA